MTTIAIVQARMGSTRLPGKVLADVGGLPLVGWTLARAKLAKSVDAVWLATSERAENDPLAAWAEGAGYKVFRGDEDDVLSRFAAIARQTKSDVVVRLTADCPFIDPEIIDAVVALRAETSADYASNCTVRRYPDGLDVEVATAAALLEADAEAQEPFLRQHVMPYIHGRRRDRFPAGDFRTADLAPGAADFSALRWTVDEPRDLAFARAVAAEMPGRDFGWQEVVALLTRRPELMRINAGTGLNEGIAGDLAKAGRTFAASNAMLVRALKTIPLASQTFSKSYQQWVKGATPLFIDRGRGAQVFDVDNNPYIDYVLGLLPIILGYRDADVDAAIERQLAKGIVFPLPSPLEIEAAERLTRLIPCAEMVRFGKNGSDATSAAVRLARAHTGRDKVLVAGYHGWHDWYIGSTTRDLGVPAAVRALTGAIAFNDAEALEKALLAEPDKIAAVVMEPGGAYPPAPGYLQRVRELTARFGVVLVFDEIITGFRMSLNGAQARYGVTPDLASFGKSIANGMPLAAVVGRRDIMRRMEDVFVSGTFGGEALSLAAAAATIDKLEREDVCERLAVLGERLMAMFNAEAARAGLGDVIAMAGEGWWPRIKWLSQPVATNLLVSLFRQEFVANGLILGASFNLCLAHDDAAVEAETQRALATAFAAVRDHLNSSDPAGRLRGEPFQPTFSVR
jgi:glutamate-1-semialdehyde 2,1-aminomutase/spore coat polysaccharide biosynthesis protein SpsF